MKSIWVILIVFAPFLSMLVPALMAERENRRFNLDIQKRGRLTSASILRYVKQKYIYVEYQYTPEGSQTPITSKKKIHGWAFKRLPPGSTVRAWYLLNQPTISVLEPYLAKQDALS